MDALLRNTWFNFFLLMFWKHESRSLHRILLRQSSFCRILLLSKIGCINFIIKNMMIITLEKLVGTSNPFGFDFRWSEIRQSKWSPKTRLKVLFHNFNHAETSLHWRREFNERKRKYLLDFEKTVGNLLTHLL